MRKRLEISVDALMVATGSGAKDPGRLRLVAGGSPVRLAVGTVVGDSGSATGPGPAQGGLQLAGRTTTVHPL